MDKKNTRLSKIKTLKKNINEIFNDIKILEQNYKIIQQNNDYGFTNATMKYLDDYVECVIFGSAFKKLKDIILKFKNNINSSPSLLKYISFYNNAKKQMDILFIKYSKAVPIFNVACDAATKVPFDKYSKGGDFKQKYLKYKTKYLNLKNKK